MSGSAETSSRASPSRSPIAMRGAICQPASAAARLASVACASASGSNETIWPPKPPSRSIRAYWPTLAPTSSTQEISKRSSTAASCASCGLAFLRSVRS